jgi:DNA-binding transcriptional ArsR family regulator
VSAAARQAVFAALADPTRRELLDRLRVDNGQTLVALSEGLGITRQAVSKHLRTLEECGLVLPIRRGRERLHYLNPVPIHAVASRWLRQFDGVRLHALVGAAEPRR